MKISILILLVVQLCKLIVASPPKGGIGDGYIYPVTKMGTKPKSTTTYYAKPLHPPMKKPSGPKPMVYKVIIHDQPPQNAARQEQIFKVIRLPKQGGGNNGGGGGGAGSHHSKSVKILKIIPVKPPKGSHGGGWSK